jgi:hypothetical protein
VRRHGGRRWVDRYRAGWAVLCVQFGNMTDTCSGT